jgi:hypothetical protein
MATGLQSRLGTYDYIIRALQGAFRNKYYAVELESRLRSRKQGPDDPVMSYCLDMIYLCSRVDSGMPEERKIQFIFQNMDPFLIPKCFPKWFSLPPPSYSDNC